MTHFVNPKDVQGDLVAHLVDLTGGGADYTFDCTGNVNVMRTALECCHRGWGQSIVIGVAEAGKEIASGPSNSLRGVSGGVPPSAARAAGPTRRKWLTGTWRRRFRSTP